MKKMIPQKLREEKEARHKDTLTLVGALLNRETHVELRGTREALVEGCKGIVEYREDSIRINMQQGQCVIGGRTLEISCMSEDSMVIRGYINKIEFCQ